MVAVGLAPANRSVRRQSRAEAAIPRSTPRACTPPRPPPHIFALPPVASVSDILFPRARTRARRTRRATCRVAIGTRASRRTRALARRSPGGRPAGMAVLGRQYDPTGYGAHGSRDRTPLAPVRARQPTLARLRGRNPGCLDRCRGSLSSRFAGRRGPNPPSRTSSGGRGGVRPPRRPLAQRASPAALTSPVHASIGRTRS